MVEPTKGTYTNKRDTYIDFLRFLGLTLIIIAHIHAPEFIAQIRGFDVPLMVLVSGMSYKANSSNYLSYIKKRFIRLYQPVFFFLTFFFLTLFILRAIGLTFIPMNMNTILGSYLLLQEPSIGFVWIIRVFILSAFIAPICYKICGRLSAEKILLSVIGVIILQTILCTYINPLIENIVILKFIFTDCTIYAFGYSIFLFLGILVKQKNLKGFIWLLYGGAFLLLCVFYSFPEFNVLAQKYPPSGIFLCYGVGACSILLGIKPLLLKVICSNKIHAIIKFISINSIWIYLWHIPFVFFINHFLPQEKIWILRWIVVYLFACITIYIQNFIIRQLSKQKI